MTPNAVLEPYDVSRETADRLTAYADLVRKWTRAINLVSASSADDLWGRHIADSLQLWRLAPQSNRSWLDIGSGGGFPGLPVAILAAEKSPAMNVTLVESDERKSAFLTTACRDLGLKARIVTDRIENVESKVYGVVSARALAPLPKLLEYAHRFTDADTVCLFPKGRQYAVELVAAEQSWRFRNEMCQSKTDPTAVILRLSDLHRV